VAASVPSALYGSIAEHRSDRMLNELFVKGLINLE
jgi:hypothetical protein